ncbi:hypothetical protein K470DRAFT_255814 [Piedraia hortae CBS 480.64]|uniref:Uncharacterized protein n=1 Tax=Piedraia hortae CBS 480.64 TaxID=1314780 RepID=A0A6A7C5K6_9PEZI|nr:hypothetical protein K470DRAFT_255814 [Piedraia hortae CBS 480.64]
MPAPAVQPPPNERLHSDHLNYLVFRYLQEYGHEASARAFYSDWTSSRPAQQQILNPEDLPFAHAVPRQELPRLVQAAVFYDGEVARFSNTDRKIEWIAIRPGETVRPPVVNRNTTQPTAPPPVRGSARQNVSQTNDFPAPDPKRVRLTPDTEQDLDVEDVPTPNGGANGEYPTFTETGIQTLTPPTTEITYLSSPSNFDLDGLSSDPNIDSTTQITNLAYNTDNSLISFATSPSNDTPPEKIWLHAPKKGSYPLHAPCLLDPAGYIFSLTFSPSGTHLLLLRSNLEISCLQIFSLTDPMSIDAEIIASKYANTHISSAEWIDENTFLALSREGVLEVLELSPEHDEPPTARGLRCVFTTTNEVKGRVFVDASLSALIFAESNELFVMCTPSPARFARVRLQSRFADLKVQPSSEKVRVRKEGCIAVGVEEGFVGIYALRRDGSDENGDTSLSLTRITDLHLPHSIGEVYFAWEPKGDALAIVNEMYVRVWKTGEWMPQGILTSRVGGPVEGVKWVGGRVVVEISGGKVAVLDVKGITGDEV